MSALKTLSRRFGEGAMASALVLMPASMAFAKDGANNQVAPTPVASRTVDAVPSPELRDTPYCAPSQNNMHGLDMGASGTAWKYSADNLGAVGIYIAPGNDLNGYSPEELGTHFVNAFLGANVKAECFISDRHAANGTAVDFNVNGLSWGRDKMLNLQQATDVKTLKAVTAEAKTGKMLLQTASASNTALNP